jgi:hypothetical protein
MFCLARVMNVRPKFHVKSLNEFQTMKVLGLVLSKYMGCLSFGAGVIETHGLLKFWGWCYRNTLVA